MRCLVTGGAGFIGANLALELESGGHDVMVADNFSSGHRDNLNGFKGTVLDVDVSAHHTFDGELDAIFHQAAITDPRHPDDLETFRQNVQGFDRMMHLTREKGAKLVYASTASLYGNGPAPQREDQPKELFSAYAVSKLTMDEMACHWFGERHIVGLRYFNVFGPREHHKGRPASMIYHLSRQIRAGQRPRIFNWGEKKRDHIYVRDCVRANLEALDAPSGIYNVGTGVATHFDELVRVLNQILGTELEPEYFEMPYDPETYQINTRADTERARKHLGFQARYTLEQGIEEYMGYLEEAERGESA